MVALYMHYVYCHCICITMIALTNAIYVCVSH